MEPGTAIAVGQVSAKALSLIWKYYSEVMSAKKEIQYLASELQSLQNVMQRLSESLQSPSTAAKAPTTGSLEFAISQSLLDINAIKDKLDPGKGTKVMKRLGRRALEWPFTKKEVDEWIQKLQRLKATVDLALSADQTSLLVGVDANVTQLRQGQDVIEQERLLGKLAVAYDAAFDSYHRQHEPKCVSDTRKDLLRQLGDWSQHHQPPIFWLSGMAGTGKSTISRTLAASFQAQQILGGSFFFSRGSGEANTAVNFVGTLVQQMASSLPQFKQHICEAISEHRENLKQGLRNQWKDLLVEPMQKTILKDPPSVNFVIDALDECGSDQEIRILLQLFVEIVELKTINLGIFVTSRPELSTRDSFKKMPQIMHHNLDLRDIPRKTVEQDIRTFVRQELAGLSRERGLHDWPSERQISDLAQKADCLFIYAATACRFIGDTDWNPSERLSDLLRSEFQNESATAQLDDMYTQVLTYSLVDGRHAADIEKLCERFRTIVGPIVLLFDELAVSELARLLALPASTLELCLSSLHSVINVPATSGGSLRLLHPSFHDFLVSEHRCQDQRFWVQQSLVHSKLAERCLETLSSGLRRNIGQLSTPGSPPHEAEIDTLKSQLPKYVRYACRYWVDHLLCTEPEDRQSIGLYDSGKVHSFFLKDFLHWFEAMSLLGQTPDAVRMITRLLPVIESNEQPALYAMVYDARRFALDNRAIVEQAPLQAYISALVFSPMESLVRNCYSKEMPAWLIRLPETERKWSNCVQTLEGPGNGYSSIAFSPDGRYLASASESPTLIQLWDTATGALCNTLDSRPDNILQVTFLADDHLVSISNEGTIRIWDPLTGVLRRMSEHFRSSSGLPSIHLRPSGDICVCWSDGQAPQVYNPWQDSWESLDCIFDWDGYGPDAFYTRAGNLFYTVEGSKDRKIIVRAYDWTTGGKYCVTTDFEYFSKCDVTFALSSDNLLALSPWLTEGSIELHNLATNTRERLSGHSSSVSLLMFSPNGEILVSSFYDGTLWMWHVSSRSHALIGICSHAGNKLAISTTGQQMAVSAIGNPCVQLWDLPIENFSHNGWACLPKEEPLGFIRDICFSLDGEQVASCLYAGQDIQLYNTRTGALEHDLRGHADEVWMVKYLPNGAIVSYSMSEIRLWDPQTRKCERVLDIDQGDPFKRYSLSFSCDGKWFALYCCGIFEPPTIWNMETKQILCKLGSSPDISHLTWSRDNKIATLSSDHLRLWDITSGGLLADISMPNGRPSTAAFSPGGRLLAWETSHSIMIYDFDKFYFLPQLGIIKEGYYIDALAISGDNKYIAAVFWDYKNSYVEIWNIETRQLVGGVNDIGARLSQISFSPNGSYLDTNLGYIPTQIRPIDENRAKNYWGRGEGEWITESGRKMLWVPHSFRGDQMVFHHGLFAVSGIAGKIRWLGLSEDRATTDMGAWMAREE